MIAIITCSTQTTVMPRFGSEPNHRHHLLDFWRREAGHDFVEQQQHGLGRQRAGKLQFFELPDGETCH